MLFHSLYLMSRYVVGVLPANEMTAQLYIFSAYVAVYMFSFFRLGKIRYLLIIPYCLLMVRVVPSLYFSFNAGDFVFFSVAGLSQFLLMMIVYNILKNKSDLNCSDSVYKVVVAIWVMAVSVISIISIININKEFNVYTLIYYIVFVASFSSVQFMTQYKKWLNWIQLVLLIGLSIPYIMSILTLQDNAYVRMVVLGSSVVLCLAFFSLIFCFYYYRRREQ